ncbi:hypothetical protein A1Q2_06231 [Trichosporon asahii var. asahii CBS 8904]|uniref:histone acetyltransferase n=1 Tax=Trichosporon asahii var. asahii (strain CBS 8904) TaxID=1220162 RepID=K1V662_TRIAC|nr:hypothetical protein A1Q2_06231 [Trichosporon asahii var. asahii CBS 8904]
MSRPSAVTLPAEQSASAASWLTLPNAVPLDLVVLQSAPKRTTEIFPHAPSAAVRCVDREFLVVVSCGLPALPDDTGLSSNSNTVEGEKSASGTEGAKDSTNGGKVLAAAISAHVYTLPNSAAELVYISKVDSSGYASACGPLTRVLASSFISYFLEAPGTVAATLFARAQGQYLFPNSVEGGGKRVLGGLGLCGWWKRVFEDAASKVIEAEKRPVVKPRQVELSYLLPSYSAAEARGMLPAASALPAGVKWDYKPPFTHRILPGTSLATLIPSLPDDPKTRFLEELVDDALDKEPYAVRERRRSSQAKQPEDSKDENGEKSDANGEPKDDKEKERAKLSRKERETEAEEEERRKAYAALENVPTDEFWERMGFRQECASGDVTGFFHVLVVPDPEGGDASSFVAAAEAQQLAAESKPDSKPESSDSSKPPASGKDAHTLPPALVERILTSMLNTDFGNRQLASSGTSFWTQATKSLVVDAIGEKGWDACFGSIAAKQGVQREQKRKEETVTMLQPRKKKK